jgi:hypothetical protein
VLILCSILWDLYHRLTSWGAYMSSLSKSTSRRISKSLFGSWPIFRGAISRRVHTEKRCNST